MTNEEIALTLEQFGQLLEISGESAFRVRAYSRAADAIRHLHESVADLANKQRLTEIPGVGAGIAAVIDEIVSTGQYGPFEDLKQSIPATLLEVVEIPGVGVKTVTKLYAELGIANLADLEGALADGTVAAQKGLGAKTAERISAGIAQLKRRTGRHLLGTAHPIAHAIEETIMKTLPDAHVSIAGSVRRMEETVGDIDLVIALADFQRAFEEISILPQLSHIFTDRQGHITAEGPFGILTDIVVASPSIYGQALLTATGKQEHLALLGEIPPVASEEEIYEANGLPWIPPELRQGRDEIELAKQGKLGSLVTLDKINGEFHSHTTWSDGVCTVAEMADEAKARGYQFLGISDHSKSLGIANGLDRERIVAQRQEIVEAQASGGIRLFASCEVEVDRDGNLDFEDEVLAALDIVIASTHTGLRQSRDHLTARLIRVLQNPNVDIVAHPSGRLLEQREGGDFDWDKIFPIAARTGTALEINADPARLDLSAELARRALDAGCLLTINCDAHRPESFGNIEYGVAVARRAGATPDRILNCWPLKRIVDWLASRGSS
jgi:DNA polymerase (family X)